MRTTVAIIGAGPAGLLLARLLHRAGVDCVVLEARDRAYVERRQRAGMLEQGAADVLRECGAGDRLDREGLVHRGFELRFEGEAHRVDLPSLTGGRTVTLYPQTEVVKDLIALQLADGPPLLFGARVVAVEKTDGEQPLIRFVTEEPDGTDRTDGTDGTDGAEGPSGPAGPAGPERTLECEYVAGCDGSYGASRRALPPGAVRMHARTYPYSWLGILADVAPSSDELLLAGHERGFALHSMRTPALSRLYIQVPNGTSPGDWPDDRIWDELDVRLAAGGWRLQRGPVLTKSVSGLRSQVIEPMRHGRLLLAGDAAHIVPPSAAKGLNLAFGDVVTMARAFTHWHRSGSTSLIDRYSDNCLRRVWQAQAFSHEMTTLLHTPPGADAYDRAMQLTRLRRLTGPTAAAAELAENYAGAPLI
ncbi:4-hydroxybenzoate 3-monooxygenase [Streptomyces telluris]|uniref:4-hydroxybenzoate 3-monooxygenase n=1 Tax=Streptomyces telluris TaxID=2720021 RepID=A0A9X2RQ08_9ACTN|nr:4-hydroxybenzoate 3-monooxygenase [Streptomyces telluris]MCQ8771750.1 4-hydroxybenzoate 3-monooxygenase [Streptomyces telluris]NJP78732.1 4-hydroxybenzoate 3-monooxygenase [Streptomyces telluris]